MEANLVSLCKKCKALGYFGSYVRREDYIENVSDINIFAITDDKSLLLELGSYNGISPIVVSEEKFKEICKNGDVICYYILHDSRLICGELPKVEFSISNNTCERLKLSSSSFIKLSYEAFKRNDEVSTLENAYRALRSLIQYISCNSLRKIPVSNSEIKDTCMKLNLNFCKEFDNIIFMRNMRNPLTVWSLNRIYNIINSQIKLDFSSTFA
ncbi:hypothetical protein [Acidianus sp. HS-5]|uniref:hypothetical protein n=1 Tax=Acidianus sp. HS-5 TaxID=2886040 RepID=UPI001F45A70E|nr:hypothetical protein [Acidianus sp. HS-5]BDC19418.1 hypothetical protein HS5_23080 [Acidianus sp. HS-5]